MTNPVRATARGRGAVAALACSLLLSTAAFSAPPIRTNAGNKVPSCVSPSRLMAFLRERNGDLDSRYDGIAQLYKQYGEAWGVRWDYAFYQMVLETNYLKYRRGNGRRGDVHERQNNFAGIGATGGGVAGERFADIKTGVHAQIQHLVAYSGERVAEPVAKRTYENQDDIIAKSRRLGRPVTFGDLARRWATDRRYAQSIDTVAGLFNDGYCRSPALAEDTEGAPVSKVRYADASGLGGPRPLKLAGPETLPWEGGDTAQGSAHERAADPSPPSADKGPVRTLWSRDKGRAPKESPGSEKPRNDEARIAPAPAPGDDAAAAPAVARRSAPPATPAASEQARPAGSMSPEPAAAPETAEAAPEPAELPTFRIAPVKPEPSRLGGPVAAATPQPAAGKAAPQGTFVELDPPPVIREAPRLVPAAAIPTGAVKKVALTAPPPSAVAPQPAGSVQEGNCRVLSASYGGRKTLLVQSEKDGVLQLTALTVLDGFEDSMVKSYAKANAPGATVVASFDSKDKALAHAREICAGN